MRHVIEQERDRAVEELKFFITCKARECQAYGWDYYLDDNAPESFSELKLRSKSMRIPIATAGNSTSIYGEEVNAMFRFWHDVNHLELDEGFSLEGETKVIHKHLEEAKDFRLSELAMDILIADTLGQVEYYYRHKDFVSNQAAFIDTCIKIGWKRAIAYTH